jgi:hypothetical protein
VTESQAFGTTYFFAANCGNVEAPQREALAMRLGMNDTAVIRQNVIRRYVGWGHVV